MQPFRAGDYGIIPAYAGSTKHPFYTSSSSWDHPRIRGEHGELSLQSGAIRGSSPHTRGAPRRAPPRRFSLRIIPAYAGSTFAACRNRARPGDHPRIRGEHNGLVVFSLDPHGSSPHTRGAPFVINWGTAKSRIIPAYAGSTCTSTHPWRVSTDHPRIRGEHYLPKEADIFEGGSSPHTRGARPRGLHCRYIVVDHPRIRGEHRLRISERLFGYGSSPHTRGALQPRMRAS